MTSVEVITPCSIFILYYCIKWKSHKATKSEKKHLHCVTSINVFFPEMITSVVYAESEITIVWHLAYCGRFLRDQQQQQQRRSSATNM